MTLPAFSQAGTGSTGNPSWPTHATGDFGMLFIEADASSITTPSGWIAIPGFPVTQPSTKLYGFYRFATSSSESAPTIAGSAIDHTWSVILTYTGVNSINPFHLVATTSAGSAALKTFPGFTTFLQDCLIVNVMAWGLDNAGPLYSGEVNADLGSLTERYDAGTTSASGGGLYANDGTKASKGAFTYTEVTGSISAVTNGATLALQSADQSFGTKSQIVNNKRRTMFVKQSTAQDWRFAMFDSADGVTGKTGLTLAVTIQKQGDTSFGSISPTVTEIGSGHYNAALTTTHMNTVGCTSLRATATGAVPADCPNCIDVIGFDKTDAAALGLSRIDAAITTRLAPTTAGRTLDVAATGEAGLDFDNIKDASSGHTLTNITVPIVTTVGTLTTYTGNTPQTGDAFARLGAPAGASHAADVAAVKGDTAAIKTKTDQFVFTVANQVDANALTGGGGGGGGAGVSAGYGEQSIEKDASAPIHFTLLDASGARVTGAVSAINAKLSINGGSAVAATGAFFEIDAGDQPGEYYYTPDTGEDSAIGTLVLYLTPDAAEFVACSVMARITDVMGDLASIMTDAGAGLTAVLTAIDNLPDNVWSVVLEGSSTAADMMRGQLSILAGKVTSFLTNTLVFKGAINAAKSRWTFTVDSTGRLTSTPGDLT